MSVYSLGFRTTSGTNATAAWELIPASSDRPRVLEIGITLVAATASVYGLGRPAAIGITPTTPVTVLTEEDDPVGTVQSAVAWGTGPTAPTAFQRRVSFKAEIGAGCIWTFPKGLIIPISSSLVLWNLAGNSLVDGWVVVDE